MTEILCLSLSPVELWLATRVGPATLLAGALVLGTLLGAVGMWGWGRWRWKGSEKEG
jgi:hypothetical protein